MTALPEVNVLGCRGVITGGQFETTRTAVYTEKQFYESSYVPAPAAAPITDQRLTLELTMLWGGEKSPSELVAELAALGVVLDVCMNTEGML